MIRSSRDASDRWLRSLKFSPEQNNPSRIELVGFGLMMFVGKCIVAGLGIFLGCCASLVVMAVFSSHSDELLRIGLSAAIKAALYLSPTAALVWFGMHVYHALRRRD